MRIAVMATATLLSVCSCAFVTESPRFAPGPNSSCSFTERGPAKVHMLDGSVVTFATGVSARRDTLNPATQPAVVPSTPVRQRSVRPSVTPFVRTVRGVLVLQEASNLKPQAASLLDILGRKVLDLHPGANDVRALAPGVYFVRESQAQAQVLAQVVHKVVVAR
ncbi:MAG: hypothetical protein NTX53_04210 [candidate division WOR-3 bacterium]|nr:hypothetical protein [candidate division WOR-3 bacterium]